MTTTLDDPTALRLLRTVAGPRLHASPSQPPTDDPALLAALTEAFGPPPEGPPPTDADLARAALALAAEEPPVAHALEAMTESAVAPVMGLGETVAILTAAIAILQAHIKIERSQAGKWTIAFEKKPASDALLKGLAQVVMKALGAGGGAGGERKRLPPGE
jgi:hypothetical protein